MRFWWFDDFSKIFLLKTKSSLIFTPICPNSSPTVPKFCQNWSHTARRFPSRTPYSHKPHTIRIKRRTISCTAFAAQKHQNPVFGGRWSKSVEKWHRFWRSQSCRITSICRNSAKLGRKMADFRFWGGRFWRSQFWWKGVVFELDELKLEFLVQCLWPIWSSATRVLNSSDVAEYDASPVNFEFNFSSFSNYRYRYAYHGSGGRRTRFIKNTFPERRFPRKKVFQLSDALLVLTCFWCFFCFEFGPKLITF